MDASELPPDWQNLPRRSVSQRYPYPGYRWKAGPTVGWNPPAPGPFAWIAYSPPDENNMSMRVNGFGDDLDACAAAAHNVASGYGP